MEGCGAAGGCAVPTGVWGLCCAHGSGGSAVPMGALLPGEWFHPVSPLGLVLGCWECPQRYQSVPKPLGPGAVGSLLCPALAFNQGCVQVEKSPLGSGVGWAGWELLSSPERHNKGKSPPVTPGEVWMIIRMNSSLEGLSSPATSTSIPTGDV